jgi:peptide/nickel transport system substrate-binding protein
MDPKVRNIIVVAIVVVILVAGIGFYLVRVKSASSSTTCGTPLKSTTTIQIDQAETVPDNIDPAATFSTPGWAVVQQVYQGLVQYNGSSYTSFVGVLAQNWTEANNPATNFTEYTFHLRSGVTFSNGDPYNAYVQWYSFYRSMLLEQGPLFILEQNFFSTNFSASNPLSYYSDLAAIQAANATLVSDLNSWNFANPTSTEIAMMETANQSFQVINANTIELNLGYGYLDSNYTYLLASISAPNSYAVDPAVVDAHGGVVEGDISNDWLATNAVGTGQYTLSDYNDVVGGGYTLTPWSGYWGKSAAAAEPWNSMLQPANQTVEVSFQEDEDVTISDLDTGAVATASFAYLGPSAISELMGNPCLNVQILPTVYGATSGSWWIYLNQTQYPFNNLSVREAIAHAINYQQIISEAFGGYASQWVGPVPPSYPDYNPGDLSPYQYNLTLAKQEIANSPCANGACSGDTIKYEYIDLGDWASVGTLLENDLSQIGISIEPSEIELTQLYSLQTLNNEGVCTTATAAYGGPYYMGQEFYTSDYISPDDWTQNDFVADGSANQCMAGFNSVALPSFNSTLNNLTYTAAATPNNNATNNATLAQDYATMTTAMYNSYTEIWLVVPAAVSVQSIYLHGYIQNPMASAEPFALLFNTQWVN